MKSADGLILSMIEGLRQDGRLAPKSVIEIPGFPYPTFEALQQAVLSRKMHLQRFSFHYESDVFTLLASSTERFINNTYLMTMMISPVAAIVLGYLHSWWWLLAAVAGLITGSKGMKRVYNRVILSSALGSELEFCYLYFLGQVCLTTTDFRQSLYWKKSIGEA